VAAPIKEDHMSNPPSELQGVAQGLDPALATLMKTASGGGPGAAASIPEDSGTAPQRTSGRAVAAILLGQAGSAAATLVPPLVALPIFVGQFDPEGKTASLGLALGLYAFIQMLLAPVFGALSDRTIGRWGMRKPGILAGAAVVIGSLFIQGLATSVAVLIVGTLLMAVGAAAFTASFSALIPDQIPAKARGRVLGFQSLILVVIGVTASIVGPMLLSNQLLIFTGGGIVFALMIMVSMLLLKDRVLDKRDIPEQSITRVLVEGFAFNPRNAPDFAWVWAGRFLVTLGLAFATTFSIYFLTDQLHVSTEELPSLISLSGVVSLGGVVTGTLLGGFLSGKLGRLKSLVLGTGVLLFAGAAVAAFAPDVPVFLVGTALIALAIGSFLPLDGALVMEVLPGGGAQTGKYMSIITIADQLPRSIGPFLAPAVIGLGSLTPLGGYPLLYLSAGVAAIIGGLVVRRVRNVR
jgi:MFS family permease